MSLYDTATIMAQKTLNREAAGIEIPQAFLERFPDLKRDKAERYFRDYLDAVMARLVKHLPFLRDGMTYVSMSGLIDECGEFRYKTQRFYKWNAFKDIYPLFVVVEKGSNIKAATNPYEKNTRVRIVNERLIEMLLDDKSPAHIYHACYKEADLLNIDGWVDIDMENLERYIGSTSYELEKATNDNHRAKLKSSLWQAQLVHKIGQHTQNINDRAALPLIPSDSPFGRTFYKGMNIQNVAKEVRSAIIGHHYQYDMNAAVFAIKLSLYSEVLGSDNAMVGTKLATYTRQYLAEKKAQRERLAKLAFNGIDLPWEAKVKAIKNGLTAIGFGAKTAAGSWMVDGNWQTTALADVIKSPDAREAFLSDSWVKAFIAEQKVIEDTIIDSISKSDEYVVMSTAIAKANKKNGKVTRAGLLTYLYGNLESHFMDEAVAVLNDFGIAPLARIHDAFLVREKLSPRVMSEITARWKLRDYLTLDCDEVREWASADYRRARDEADGAEAQHERTMETAEKVALIYANSKR